MPVFVVNKGFSDEVKYEANMLNVSEHWVTFSNPHGVGSDVVAAVPTSAVRTVEEESVRR